MTTPLLDHLIQAVRSAAADHRGWTDKMLMDACQQYVDYFAALEDNSDAPPPTSADDPDFDALLLLLWDVIVDREEAEADAGDLTENGGDFVSYEQLYEDTFDDLIETVLEETEYTDDPRAFLLGLSPPPAALPDPMTVERINELLGIRLLIDTPIQLPDEAADIIDRLQDPATDIKELRRDIRQLQSRFAENQALAETELYLLAASSNELAIRRQAEIVLARFPQSVAARYILVQGATTAEDVNALTGIWGVPPDIHRAFPDTSAGVPLADYHFFEEAATKIDLLNRRYGSALPRMERLLALGLADDSLFSLLELLLQLHVNDQVQRGNVLPNTWEAPPYEPSAPLASQTVQMEWPLFVQNFSQRIMEEMGTGVFDYSVPHGSYRIKVTLRGIRPPIWRRLVVPADIPMHRLHLVLQAAMGWYGGHLHGFRTAMGFYGPEDDDYIESYEGMSLNILMQEPGHKITYEYDFGDGWEHEILLEQVMDQGGATQVQCLKGRRACPPEDIGGVGGYYEYLQALKKPQNEWQQEMLEWRGGDYDPEEFDVKEVNDRLQTLLEE